MARWCLLIAMACFSACATHAFPAATQGTMVVTTSDDSDAPTKEPQVTTEGPAAPIKLLEMDVRSEVSLRYARSAIVSHVRNPGHRAQETTFHVLLPETAFISGFTMTLDGKSYKAYVKEKEEAKNIYNEAVSHGQGGALITAKARDSNQFTVSVNVEPNTEAVFNLTYEELLQRRNGVYNHAVNLHPGVLVPKLTVTVHIKEGQKLSTLRVPEVRTGNEVDATDEDAQNPKATIVKSADEREATITFTPDLEEQKRLMDVYAEKSRESRRNSRPSYYYREPEQEETKAEGGLGQFVVQYDVDRPKEGEILVNDGYFVHFFAPSTLPPLHKHVVFVLDTSGSMMGRKIDQLREAMRSILADLNPGDYFNIIEFDSSVNVHDLKEADEKEPAPHFSNYYGREYGPVVLVPPSPATPLNVEKAKTIVGRLNAAGGTNIYDALTTAIDLINKGIGWTAEVKSTTASGTLPPSSSTTAAASTTQAVPVSTVAPGTSDAPKLEPIIIFLTDGDPTVGDTNPTRIVNHISEKNYGHNKATIFSLAFGEDADRTFLRKLSLRNEGFMRHIYEASDAALQLRDFYRQVSSPLLADVRFIYPPEQVKENTITKHRFRTFYMGSEAVVAGEVIGNIELEPTIEGSCFDDDSKKRKTYRVKPKVTVSSGAYLPLERLWAYLTIKQLLDERDATDGTVKDTDENSPKKRALGIALKYEFVTPLTSLVVVKPNATSAVDAESVDKPDEPQAYPNAGGYSTFPKSVPSFAFASAPGAGVGAGFAARPSIVSGNFRDRIYSSGWTTPVSFLPGLPGPPAPGASAFVVHDLPQPMNLLPAASSSSIRQASIMRMRPLMIPLQRPVQYPFGGSRRAADFSADAVEEALESEPDDYSSFSAADALSFQPASSFADIRFELEPGYFSTPLVQPPTTGAATSTETTKVPSTEPAKVPSTEPAKLPSTEPAKLPSTETAKAPSPLAPYRLDTLPWTETLLDAEKDALVLFINSTDLTLKLAKDAAEEPKGPGAECSQSVTGGSGFCVYLLQCPAARNVTVVTYETLHCSRDGYAGVCCPKSEATPAQASEASTAAQAH